MTKKQLIESFDTAKELTKKNNGSIHFFMGALCTDLAFKVTHDFKESNNLSSLLLEIFNEIDVTKEIKK